MHSKTNKHCPDKRVTIVNAKVDVIDTHLKKVKTRGTNDPKRYNELAFRGFIGETYRINETEITNCL